MPEVTPPQVTEVHRFHSAEDAVNYVRWNMKWKNHNDNHNKTVLFLKNKLKPL